MLDRVGRQPGRGHRLAPAGEAVVGGGHVGRAGDRADARAAAGDQQLGGLPLACGVVDVDVGHPVAAGPRAAAEDARQAEVGEVLGEPVVAVVGDDQRAVDVPVGEVAQGPRGGGARPGQQQHELDVALPQHPGHPAQGAGEERVGEDPVVGLGHDHGDRVRTPGDQAAGRRVRDVAELAHRQVDRGLGAGADPLAAVDGARGRGARDTRDTGHLVQGGGPGAERGPRGVHARHVSGPSDSTAGSVPERDSSAYHRALDLGIRCWVS